MKNKEGEIWRSWTKIVFRFWFCVTISGISTRIINSTSQIATEALGVLCETVKLSTNPHTHCSRFYFVIGAFAMYMLFIYLGFYVAFNTVQVISRRVVGRAEETSTYSSSGFCTVNCRPTASNYKLSHLRLCREPNPSLRGGRRECYHSATMTPE